MGQPGEEVRRDQWWWRLRRIRVRPSYPLSLATPFANNVNQLSTKEMFRSVTYLTEWLLPSVKTSKPKPATPFGVAFDTDNFYEFMERPENAYRLTQFTRSMSGARATQGEKTIATQSGVYCIHGFMRK